MHTCILHDPMPLHTHCPLVSNTSIVVVVVVVVVQWINHVLLFVTSWTAAHQTPLSLIISQILSKFISIELVMLYNQHPLPPSSPFAITLSQHQGLF